MIPQGSVIILQARMGSSRLPGKAVQQLAGRTLVGWCLDRLKASLKVPVLLATTSQPEDDVLEREASIRRIQTFRGPVDDVLRRFRMAAASAGARYVVRATADNPAVDLEAPGRVLRMMAATKADYVTERGLPYGCAVEAVTLSALQRADARVVAPIDREHVTALIRREHALFNALEVSAPTSLRRPDLRLTVDTVDDLLFMRAVLSRVDRTGGEPSLSAIIDAADRVLAEAVAT